MIEQILDYIHNYFDNNQPSYYGKFVVSGGIILLNGNDDMGIKVGQFYRVIGSVFNDGIWRRESDEIKYGLEDLRDEEFIGEVRLMAVPPKFVKLVDEIETWTSKYGSVANSPYSSESFGGYSYTKAQGSSGGSGGSPSFSWQSVFGSRLNAWRKIS